MIRAHRSMPEEEIVSKKQAERQAKVNHSWFELPCAWAIVIELKLFWINVKIKIGEMCLFLFKERQWLPSCSDTVEVCTLHLFPQKLVYKPLLYERFIVVVSHYQSFCVQHNSWNMESCWYAVDSLCSNCVSFPSPAHTTFLSSSLLNRCDCIKR